MFICREYFVNVYKIRQVNPVYRITSLWLTLVLNRRTQFKFCDYLQHNT